MFSNLENPTETDYEMIQLIWRYMSPDERTKFVENIQQSFSNWDQTAIKELTKTINFIKSA